VSALRGTLGRIPLPDVVSGSAPDAAWGWAFGAALAIVWRGRAWREKASWLIVGCVLAVAVEIGQGMRIIPGTFDLVDLFAIGLGFAMGAFVAGRSEERDILTA
jgi:hypothetical protein